MTKQKTTIDTVISFLCDSYGYSDYDFVLYDNVNELINDYFEGDDMEIYKSEYLPSL